jgi:2,3,4,5-tetrahydropyridine-2,6-dicarboxylate N-succinyltransferase
VLAAGVVLAGGTVVHDLVRGRTRQREVPAGAMVVPGSRPAAGDYARTHDLQQSAPLIARYRAFTFRFHWRNGAALDQHTQTLPLVR